MTYKEAEFRTARELAAYMTATAGLVVVAIYYDTSSGKHVIIYHT